MLPPLQSLEVSAKSETDFLRQQNKELSNRVQKLSVALCDMLFVFTCFEEQGIEKYPEEMQAKLRAFRHNAREAYVGKPLEPLQPIQERCVDLSCFDIPPHRHA